MLEPYNLLILIFLNQIHWIVIIIIIENTQKFGKPAWFLSLEVELLVNIPEEVLLWVWFWEVELVVDVELLLVVGIVLSTKILSRPAYVPVSTVNQSVWELIYVSIMNWREKYNTLTCIYIWVQRLVNECYRLRKQAYDKCESWNA